MNSTSRPKEPLMPPAHLDEADVGSGEKTPAEHEAEEIIRNIPPLPKSDNPTERTKLLPQN